ncbi:type II toxin-antitoxin system RelE/ParE family toxin [Pontibacter russatus]|uniref:type II toxin-antitoxin system RelE/ParE family toxin n=1 Tax=Pontibacter russatus TaxID=2694929 RepID=UPI00137B078F|nr:type II toxin-antitoxin system RelE/ParE family toxin [Pontibacter russatus]
MPAGGKAVEWSARATNEYLATLGYILQHWGNEAAERFEDSIFHQIDRIARNPAQFPLINQTRAIRRCVGTPQNSIFFREQEKHIQLLSVFDTRQSPDKLKL